MKALVAALVVLALQAPNQLLMCGPVPPGAVRILFVRHGEAWKNLAIQGLSPEKEDMLTKTGDEQSATLGRVLAAVHPSAIYHSPAHRTAQTAAAIAKASPAAGPILVADAVRTQDPPKESFADVAARVDAFARELAAQRAGQQVVTVAHSEVIGSYLMRIRGDDKPSGPRLGSITVIDVPAEGAPIIRTVDYLP